VAPNGTSGARPSVPLNRASGLSAVGSARPITIEVTRSNDHIHPSISNQPGTAMHPNPFLPNPPQAIAREILGTLLGMLPSPATDTQAARATRIATAMAMVTSYRPAGVSEAQLAAQACHRAWPDSRQCRCPRQGLSPPRRPAGLPSRRHSLPACPGRRIAGVAHRLSRPLRRCLHPHLLRRNRTTPQGTRGNSRHHPPRYHPAINRRLPGQAVAMSDTLRARLSHPARRHVYSRLLRRNRAAHHRISRHLMSAWHSFVIPTPVPPAAKQGETQMHADKQVCTQMARSHGRRQAVNQSRYSRNLRYPCLSA